MLKTKPTILVVDDEEDLRDLAAIILTEYGCSVLTAASGEDALRMLEGDFLRIDLLFSDVMMPGMSGFTLARRARQLRPDLMVVLTTGYVSPAVAAAISDGGHRVLPKPYRPAQLIQAIRDEFARTALMPPPPRTGLGEADERDSGDGAARQAAGRP
jgi:CheY-like chemotaxis protein